MSPGDQAAGTPQHLPTLELFSLAGRVAIVTGGNRNLGFGLSRGLAGAGAHVLIANPDAARRRPRRCGGKDGAPPRARPM